MTSKKNTKNRFLTGAAAFALLAGASMGCYIENFNDGDPGPVTLLGSAAISASMVAGERVIEDAVSCHAHAGTIRRARLGAAQHRGPVQRRLRPHH